MSVRLAVIGGGAAGLMAALTAADRGCQVTLYEKNERVGKKILATGNGKCNLSNLDMNISHYYTGHPELVENVLEKFSVFDTIAFFESAGMMIKEKNGYLYPVSEQASTVLDILRRELQERHVKVYCDCEVTAIENNNHFGYCITSANGQEMYDKVIVACGSRASQKNEEGQSGYRLAEALHHSVVPVVPALVQLRCREEYLKALSGVRCQAEITLLINGISTQKEAGELQLTDYGISGIPVFQFSREAAYALLDKKDVAVKIDFFPDYSEAAYRFFVENRYENGKDQTLEDFLLGIANKKINQVMIKSAGYKGTDKVTQLDKKAVIDLLWGYKKLRLHITAANSFENAQVCAGGVSLRELSKNMESMFLPGMYFVGELLDVDGRCGGYNLQWAWASGYVAGVHAAGTD